MEAKNNLIDIHTHIIPNVDDGPKSFIESLEILRDLIKDGVKYCIATPHIQSKQQYVSKEQIIINFEKLKELKNQENLDIKLYLGFEIMYLNHSKIDYKKYTLSNSNYILLEFNLIDELPVRDIVFNISRKGINPIIAHTERYSYLSIKDIINIKSNGALIQVNADSLLRVGNFKERRFARKLLKHNLIDFVASDLHNGVKRKSHLKDAYNYALKKTSKEYVDDIFVNNAQKIINKK